MTCATALSPKVSCRVRRTEPTDKLDFGNLFSFVSGSMKIVRFCTLLIFQILKIAAVPLMCIHLMRGDLADSADGPNLQPCSYN